MKASHMTRRRVLRNWDEAVRFQPAFRGLDFRLLAPQGDPRRLRRREAEIERHIEEGRRLDALDEQSRRRGELQQKRRRMSLLRAVLSAGCDRCDAEAAGFDHNAALSESRTAGGGRSVGL